MAAKHDQAIADVAAATAPPPPRVILVTGANRGIGFAIIQQLANHPSTRDAVLLLGCRDVVKGEAAIAALRSSSSSLSSSLHLHVIPLDVTSDSSLRHAVSIVETQFGQLDVLVNNAGYAVLTSAADFSDYRIAWADTFNANVTSVALTTQFFLPLLRRSAHGGKVVNVSSARASLGRTADGKLPPTASIAYSASKAALNLLTLDMALREENKGCVEFQLASPGHCRTAFNGFRGTRDPLEGANVVVELVVSPPGVRKKAGFWETVGSSLDLVEVQW